MKDFHGKIDFENLKKFSIKGFRDVRKVADSTNQDRFVGVPVSGDSLRHLAIVHGDLLITKLNAEWNEKKLCVWETPNGRTAKFAVKEFDEITLYNQDGWSQTWKLNEVEMIGAVVRVERDL